MAVLIVLSDSLLGRLVVNCSGVTAFGSEGREKTDQREDSASIVPSIPLGGLRMA